MQTAIDKFGRVLIPKSIRDHLGVEPGEVVQVIEQDNQILIKLIKNKTALKMKDNIMVYDAEPTGDIEEAIKKQRDERMDDIW
jgi:AbrB family looped-hinge helix DNA binding protein